MNILVYGAGVLGSLYAARLKEAGHEVTILAKGTRFEQIRDHGIILANLANGDLTCTRVPVVDHLEPAARHDLIIVLVRKHQLRGILPALAANQSTPNILVMVNNAAGSEEILAALGRQRVLTGFPGAAGNRQGLVVQYHIFSSNTQPTTLGEPDGSLSARLLAVADVLRQAGFPTAVTQNMDAWSQTHVALFGPMTSAVYLAGGDIYRLSRTRDGLVLLVRAVREGLRALQKLNIAITPSRYRLLFYIPEPLLIWALQRGLNTRQAELLIARPANASRDEMGELAQELKMLARTANVRTPALDQLEYFINPAVSPLPEGSLTLPLHWRGMWLALMSLSTAAVAGLSLYYYRRRG
jgi:2-dehydropantoate 2-reductase